MKPLFVFLILLLLSSLSVYAIPQIDESGITDEKKFLVDNSQCIARARTGESYRLCSGCGNRRWHWCWLWTCVWRHDRGDIGARAAVGAVVGGLSGGGRSVYRTAQPNYQIYSQCVTGKGYQILRRD